MRKSIRLKLLIVVSVWCLLPNAPGRASGGGQNTAEQELLQIEKDWCAAAIKKDSGALGRILADDYTGVSSRGIVLTKAQELADVTDKESTVTVCSDSFVNVRVYGDAAVVTGLGTRTGSYKGVPYTGRQSVWTDTFIKKDGRWQCVASQATLVAAQQK